MCKPTILSQSSIGYVKHCRDCGTYTIAFNNSMVALDKKGFLGFKGSLRDCYQAHLKNEVDSSFRYIMFDTFCEGIRFLFSLDEIGEVLSMMQEAELHQYITEGEEIEHD